MAAVVLVVACWGGGVSDVGVVADGVAVVIVVGGVGSGATIKGRKAYSFSHSLQALMRILLSAGVAGWVLVPLVVVRFSLLLDSI